MAGAAQAETITVAALGDSLTAGFGLPQADGFVPQLEDWLQAQGADVEIMNAGVSGDTTAGGLSRVNWTLTPDVDAMIISLGGNDYLRGLDPAVSRQNLDGILAAGAEADVAMLLVGLEVGTNYGPAYKADFEGMYAALAEKYNVPLYPDFAAGLRAVAGTQDGMAALMQADGLHPNTEGVSAIVNAMGPAILDLIATVD
ncbi:arylesterase [Cognatiyoonia sp. IB215446]|uniref:arylesterase n=1 Tax=Cognatiyoonia sp. IB215446 TaxID=3097355 RepID=UPI002A0FE76B|nr:arylesterase [Cognatiyoonia sp. IB215446]MDX8347866.1 arylesterase [Cognatiyoonia sp. IB215446]